MSNLITSSYDVNSITVDQMLKDPTWIPQRTLALLQGTAVEELVFRNGGTNSGAVAYNEAAAPILSSDAENVAEGAEIPVASLSEGKARAAIAQKNALAIRVSLEMRTRNSVDRVTRQQTALMNTMIRTGVKATLNAFKAADVHTASASAAWTNGSGDPAKDILDAIETIQATTADDLINAGEDDEAFFGYNPDTLLLSNKKYTQLLRNEQVQKFYVGDAAGENPLYKGVQPKQMFGLNVATSRWLGDDEVYVLESGTAGFISTEYPLQMTPVYEEGGVSGSGGPQQAWRSDAFRSRIIAVDNPKAVLKITGA